MISDHMVEVFSFLQVDQLLIQVNGVQGARLKMKLQKEMGLMMIRLARNMA
jgi:hypothetical protein